MAENQCGQGAELTKHNCKTKCTCLYNTAKFLLRFQKASVTVSSAEAVHNCIVSWEVEVCGGGRWQTGYFPTWPYLGGFASTSLKFGFHSFSKQYNTNFTQQLSPAVATSSSTQVNCHTPPQESLWMMLLIWHVRHRAEDTRSWGQHPQRVRVLCFHVRQVEL